jgi:hypothetical protein
MDDRRPIPSEHIEVEWVDYTLLLHPGIQRQVSIDDGGGLDLPAYRQTGVHPLRFGETRPPSEYHLGVRGGPDGRDFSIAVNDPHGAIESATVALKPSGERAPAVTVTFEAGAVTCPPHCA